MKWKKPSVGGKDVCTAIGWELSPGPLFFFYVCVCEALPLWLLRVACLFSQVSLSPALAATPFHSPNPNPSPSVVVEHWAKMSLFFYKSNWRQAFFGMTWRWVAKSSQPSLWRIARLGSALVRRRCTLMQQLQRLRRVDHVPREVSVTNEGKTHCPNGFKSSSSPWLVSGSCVSF